MSKFQRETATDTADLPHEFRVRAGEMVVGAAVVCDTCTGAVDDPRHRAWEQQEIADRERAAQGVARETGS